MKKDDIVVCINNYLICDVVYLTIHRKYKILDVEGMYDGSEDVLITDDRGKSLWFNKSRFVPYNREEKLKRILNENI